jgi:archaemetzincin
VEVCVRSRPRSRGRLELAAIACAVVGLGAEGPAPDRLPPQRRVVLVPLGQTAPDLVAQVARAVRERFAFDVTVAEAVPHDPAAWYAPRKRWRAERLLDQLDALDLGEVDHVIGLTEQPISTTKGARYDWGIAGLGQLPGKSCVLTSYLFRGVKAESRARYRRYMENLVLHELGHTLGLPHCPLERCIMADAKGNARRAARLSSNEYCPRCHRQIQHLLRDPAPRGTWSAREQAQVGALGGAP